MRTVILSRSRTGAVTAICRYLWEKSPGTGSSAAITVWNSTIPVVASPFRAKAVYLPAPKFDRIRSANGTP